MIRSAARTGLLVVWSLGLGMSVAAAYGDDHNPRVITARTALTHGKKQQVRLNENGPRRIRVVLDQTHPGVITHATDLTAEPATGSIELRIGGQNLRIDAHEDLLHQGQFPMDENMHLARAQMLVRNALGNQARVVKGSSSQAMELAAGFDRTDYVMYRPELPGTATAGVRAPQGHVKGHDEVVRPAGETPAPRHQPIPTVPAPMKRAATDLLMASAR